MAIGLSLSLSLDLPNQLFGLVWTVGETIAHVIVAKAFRRLVPVSRTLARGWQLLSQAVVISPCRQFTLGIYNCTQQGLQVVATLSN